MHWEIHTPITMRINALVQIDDPLYGYRVIEAGNTVPSRIWNTVTILDRSHKTFCVLHIVCGVP